MVIISSRNIKRERLPARAIVVYILERVYFRLSDSDLKLRRARDLFLFASEVIILIACRRIFDFAPI